jgi:hypothetical protein
MLPEMTQQCPGATVAAISWLLMLPLTEGLACQNGGGQAPEEEAAGFGSEPPG